jgi:hypothetical protein
VLTRILQLDYTLGIARVVAILLALVMIWYFVTSNAIRADNPFLVPDALLTVLLLAATVTPRPWAAPVFIFGFAWAAAVWTTSLCTYAVRGEFAQGANHLALIAPCVVMAVLLAVAITAQR